MNMIFKTTILGLIFFAGLTKVIAHTPAPPQQHPIVVTGGTIHTITGDVITGGMLLFDKGKIVSVGRDLDTPPGTEVFDASGKHIYPGLILSRSTLGITEIGRISVSTDIAELGDINPNIRAQVAFHPTSDHLSVAAANGITTTVVTPAGSLIAGMPAAMATDGWTWEEMTIREGIAMVINWPSMNNKENYETATAQIRDAFEKARRYKHAREAVAQGESSRHHPFDIRWEALMPVLRGNMPVHITVNDIRQIQAAIAWAEKEGLNTVLVGGRDIGLAADQLAEKNIPVILTGVISGPAHQWEGYDEGYTTPLKLYEAGVDFSISGDLGASGAYRLPHHAAAAAAFGLPEDEALKAITINAARILGIDDILGSIEPGKDATIMITNGSPLEISTQIEQVFIQGRKIDMTDRHLQLYKRYKEKHRQKEIPE
jgi:imidazolonepropionase-like amidohydrolase